MYSTFFKLKKINEIYKNDFIIRLIFRIKTYDLNTKINVK